RYVTALAAQEGTWMKPRQPHLSENCRTVSEVLGRVGDKWSVLIITMLGDGPRRLNELKRMVEGISQRMLTLSLRGLERDGLVRRTVTPSAPPRVDYELTALGRSLLDPVSRLSAWALANRSAIGEARDIFDRKALGRDDANPGRLIRVGGTRESR